MSLDLRKLTKARELPNGTVIAQCPACAAAGADNGGNHLVVYPDGRFGCVIYPGPSGRAHRQLIWEAVGDASTRRPPLRLKFTIKIKR